MTENKIKITIEYNGSEIWKEYDVKEIANLSLSLNFDPKDPSKIELSEETKEKFSHE